MAKNFQTDNAKYTKTDSRTDIYNPSFNPTVSALSTTKADKFTENLHKYVDFVSWAR